MGCGGRRSLDTQNTRNSAACRSLNVDAKSRWVLAGVLAALLILPTWDNRPVAAAPQFCPALNGTRLAASSTVDSGGSIFATVCTGRVRSFDGTPIDLDVTIPVSVSRSPNLMVFLHGWGNSKTDWEATSDAGSAADQYHWNNYWFAKHGWVTLNYTARGFHASCGKDKSGYTYLTDLQCSDTPGERSWTHLADRRFEIRDFQFLTGLLVDAGLAGPRKIAVTGESYGGGQSWELALSQDMEVSWSCTTPADTNCYSPWVSPGKGIALHLAAAVPLYTWSDLEDALVQNGTASDGFHGAPPDGNHGAPIGVGKESYVDGLYALGADTAQYAVPGADPTADLSTWFSGISAGEPYEGNPTAQTAASEIGGAFRSPYAMPIPSLKRAIPVFAIQGLNDPLFDGLQNIDFVNKLEAANASYPVWSFLGDVGHSYANNPQDVWIAANSEANSWLSSVFAGQKPAQPRVTVDTTRCVSGQTLSSYSATGVAALATVIDTFSSATTATTVNASGVTAEGQAADPITNSGCRSMNSSLDDPNQAVYVFNPPLTETLLGSPVLTANVTVGGTNAEVAARLWDVDANGQQTLITRTVYRLAVSLPGTVVPVRMELWPNAWQIQCGHSLRLELTQDDAPTWRPDNEPSTLTYSNVTLALPVASRAVC